MGDKQIKVGVILSYLLILLNTLFGLLVTPYLISCLGADEYGVYKTIASLTASLMVIDLGLGSTVTRYVAKYRAAGNHEAIPNFLALSMIQGLITCALIGIIAIPVYASIDIVYIRTFSAEQMETGKTILLLLIGNMVLHVFENIVNGVITGSNQFLVGNGVKVLRLVVRGILLVVLLAFIPDARVIAIIDIGITLVLLVAELCYVFMKLKISIKLTHWDKHVFVESGVYTILMLLQNVAIQLNGNVDTVLIGAMINTTSVTVYSMALVIFSLYENLASAISSVLLPSVVKLVEEKKTPAELQKYVEKTGRVQFIVLGAALGGFVVLGNEFYRLWLGELYRDCYYLTLILIIPVTFPMLQNVALSILRAQNKMGYRTVTLMLSSVINIIISVGGIYFYGYWGAAIGTAAYSIANVFFMNIYYHRKLQFKVFSMFATIFSKTIICVLIAAAMTAMSQQIWCGGWGDFVLNAAIYVAVYGVLMIVWGFNSEERTLFHIRAKGAHI